MKTFTATKAKNHFGEVLDISKTEPVRIEKQGRESGYIISPKMFALVQEILTDAAWGESALEAAKEGFIGITKSEAFFNSL